MFQVWDLDEPIGNTESAALYAQAMNTVAFDRGDTVQRVCGANQKCFATFMSVANQRPGPTNLGPHGTIVARLENLGDAGGGNKGLEKKYNLPRKVKNTVYLLIAFRDDTNGWRWEIYSASGDAKEGARPQSISRGTWRDCGHPVGPRERGRFRTCDGVAQVAGATAGTTTGGPFLPPDEEPGWLSCSAGCCTAGQ